MDVLRAFWRGLRGKEITEKDMVSGLAEDAGEGSDQPIKSAPIDMDGRCMSIDEFVAYVEALDMPDPLPQRIFLHHTWKPTKESWRGHDTMLAMKAYYEEQLWQDASGQWHEGWTAGPHLFVADDGIWLFSDIRYDGVGVYGHNTGTRHLEMVGNYDEERPSGATLANTVAVLGVLHEKLGLDIHNLNFHRDFSTKSCPGWAVQKDWVISLVADWIAEYRGGAVDSALRDALQAMMRDLLVSTNPYAALAREAQERGYLGAVTQEIPLEVGDKPYMLQIFAETLLVPMGEWDQVTTLSEFERGRSQRAIEPADSTREDHHAPMAPGERPRRATPPEADV